MLSNWSTIFLSSHMPHNSSKAFERVKAILKPGQDRESPTEWTLLGVQVCLRAWKRLHGLGSRVHLT